MYVVLHLLPTRISRSHAGKGRTQGRICLDAFRAALHCCIELCACLSDCPQALHFEPPLSSECFPETAMSAPGRRIYLGRLSQDAQVCLMRYSTAASEINVCMSRKPMSKSTLAVSPLLVDYTHCSLTSVAASVWPHCRCSLDGWLWSVNSLRCIVPLY